MKEQEQELEGGRREFGAAARTPPREWPHRTRRRRGAAAGESGAAAVMAGTTVVSAGWGKAEAVMAMQAAAAVTLAMEGGAVDAAA